MKFAKAAVSAVSIAQGALAFVHPGAFTGTKLTSVSSSSTMQMQSEMSKSIPFVAKPPMLTGEMPGDVGFDPLELSSNLNLGHAQAAELKHGRVAMLAVVGVLVSHFVHLPAEQFSATNPIDALSKVPLAGHLQIFLFIACFELSSFGKTYNEEVDAWERLVQDPAGAKKYASMSPAEQSKAKLQEIKNGRLAMMAIMGMLVQTAIFGTPF